MDGTRPVDALRRLWWVLVLFVALGAIVGGVPSPDSAVDSTTQWNASHTILVSSTSDSGSLFTDPIAFNQLQLFATTGQVPERAAELVGFSGPPAALAAQVTVTAEQESGALRISTTQESADDSVEIADAFADELITYLAERQDELRADRLASNLDRLEGLEADIGEAELRAQDDPDDRVLAAELDALSRQYSVIFEQFNALQADASQLVLTTLERAEPVAVTEDGLTAPGSRLGRAVLGGVAGLAVGVALVLLLARSDRTIRTREQAEALLGMAASGVVPAIDGRHEEKEVSVVPDRHDPLSDAYRTLRTVIRFAEERRGPADGASITLVVSPGPGDGKTSVASNLAAAFVEAGDRTVAVNTDFRRPELSSRLIGYLPPATGIDFGDLESAPLNLLTTPGGLDGLVVLDLAGTPDESPGDLARATSRLLPRCAQVADSIVVDTSPVGVTAEVLEFVPDADVVLVVIRLGHTSVDAARRCMEMVRTLLSGEVFLIILGGSTDESGYYYYDSADSGGRRRRRRRGARPADELDIVPA